MRDRKRGAQDPRNMVRGALASLKARTTPSHKTDSWKIEQFAFQQVMKATAKAKKNLTRTGFNEYERWLAATLAEQNKQLARLGTSISCLGLLPGEMPRRPLHEELQRSMALLEESQSRNLDGFFDGLQRFATEFRNGRFIEALQCLSIIEQNHGHSYWSFELRLSCTYLAYGLEELKRTVKVTSADGTGLQKFFAYFIGIRNEPAQTSHRFKVNVNRRIEESDLEQAQKVYAKFRLYGQLGPAPSDIAQILAYEQITTTIDLLFTAIRIEYHISQKPGSFSRAVIESARDLNHRLQALLKDSPFVMDSMDSSLRMSRRADLALLNSLSPTGATYRYDNLLDKLVVEGVSSQLSTRSDGVAAEELAKAQMNYPGIPDLLRIEDVSNIPALPVLVKEVMEAVPPTSMLTMREALASQLTLAIEGTNSALATSLALRALGLAANLNIGGKPSDAIAVLQQAAVSADTPSAADAIWVATAYLQFDSGATGECVLTTASAGLTNDRLLPHLPLIELFQGAKWNTIKTYGPSVALSTCLDLYLRILDDRKIRTYKRYSVEDLMSHHGVSSITELFDALAHAGISTDLGEYFFSQVCDTYTLELLPGIGKSKKVLEIRSALLRKLASLRTPSELLYLGQAQELEDALAVSAGLEVLDDSKVYVDEKSILNSVNVNLSADFQRYLRLVESGIGVADSIASVLQGFIAPTAKTFQIPSSEADDLFAELLTNIRDKFLFDQPNGLDIIIGRRIRHGTIASELRGPLEAAGLIGQRPRAGADYDPPIAALNICNGCDHKQKKRVHAMFSRFSEAIDAQIALLRDEFFHVNAKSKPRGIFELSLNPVVFTLCRSVAQTCIVVEEFSKECIHLFWYFLSLRLEVHKTSVENELKKNLAIIFVKLSKELRALGIQDASLLSTLQQASEELQRRAMVVGSWIRVPQVAADAKRYPMAKIVSVAVAVVCGQRPGFKPVVSSVVNAAMELDTHGFSFVSDALYIALDNICQRSGKKVDNQVEIKVDFDSQASLLRFFVRNELGPSGKTPAKEAKLEEIRAAIKRRAFGESAKRDRGSGLSKLAGLVMQSPKTTIDFGYEGDSHFFLQFDLEYVATDHELTVHASSSRVFSLPPTAAYLSRP